MSLTTAVLYKTGRRSALKERKLLTVVFCVSFDVFVISDSSERHPHRIASGGFSQVALS